jgi:glycosyltransferase involved in cell wall biosynthesis
LSFSIFSFFYIISKKDDFIYSRDDMPLFLLSFFKKNIVYEAHMPRFNFIVKRFNKIVTISKGLKDFYTKKGVSENTIIVAHDAVDIKKFSIDISKEGARRMLNLPVDKKIILYTGHLYNWKGVDTLAKSAKYLNSNELIVFIGGTTKDVLSFKKKYGNTQNIFILGQKPHKEIPYYLKSADVVVLPNSAESSISKYYTSPMKLFEYMASGTPIVASDLPSIREVLNEQNAILVQSGNPETLASGICQALNNEGFACKISSQALIDVKKYTWDKRVDDIMDFIK